MDNRQRLNKILNEFMGGDSNPMAQLTQLAVNQMTSEEVDARISVIQDIMKDARKTETISQEVKNLFA